MGGAYGGVEPLSPAEKTANKKVSIRRTDTLVDRNRIYP